MEKLTNEQIAHRLQEQFGDDIYAAAEPYDMLTMTVNAKRILPILRFLKEDQAMGFNFLTDECGIHYPFNKGQEIGVIYHLHNMRANIRIRVEAFISSENPVIDSATALWPAANWMERETYDFYGILFEGHPDLRRILNVDEMDYFPMLKQYPLEDATREDKNDKMFGR